MAMHSSILAWRILWTEETGKLQYMGLQRVEHNFQMFKLHLKKEEEPDQISNIHWIIKKAREFQKNIYFCFTDYTKALVWITTNLKILKDMGIPDHLTCFLDFPGCSDGKASSYNAGDPGSIPGSGKSPKEMVTHSRILAWKIPWTRSLEGYHIRCHKELDATDWLLFLYLLPEKSVCRSRSSS